MNNHDETVADQVYQRVPGYLRLFEELVKGLQQP